MNIKSKSDQCKEFTRLMLTGNCTQKEAARQLGIAESTACRWMKDLPVTQYFSVRKRLIAELNQLSKDYTNNADNISRLMADIEKLDGLIRKAKFIPHLQN